MPSTLRLLMGAVTYLEWSTNLESSNQQQKLFFGRLKEALGPPQLRPNEELDESDEEENISRIFEELAKKERENNDASGRGIYTSSV